MMESKTPRTDACFYEHDICWYDKQNPNATMQTFKIKSVGIDFARQLETELNEARAYIERLKDNSEKQIKFQTELVNEAEKDIDRKNALIRQMLEALNLTDCYKLHTAFKDGNTKIAKMVRVAQAAARKELE